jgi:hypothetical protein
MARNRKPTSILEGNGAFDHDPARRRERANEPQCTGPLGPAPETFDPLQLAAWNEIVSIAPEGVLFNADRILVEMLARLVARDRNPESYPLTAAERSLVLRALGKLGLTPSDRAGMNVPQAPQKPKNRFEQMAAENKAKKSDVQ